MTVLARRFGPTWPERALPIEVSVSSLVAGLVGMTAVVAVALGVPRLTSIVPSHVPVAANTGICLVLMAIALRGAYVGRRAAAIPAALVLMVGVVTALQFVTGNDVGIDQWLFGSPPGSSEMSPQTAVALILLAIGILSARSVIGALVIRGGTTIVLLLAMVNVLDVIYGAQQPTFLGGYTQMALPTAVSLVALALGIGTLGPDRGILELVRQRGPAGALSRRLLLAAVLIPIIVGWLRLAGERAGLYETAYGVGLTSLASIALFTGAVHVTARAIQRSEAARERAEAERERARAEAEAANLAKSEFLSRMSHELRTPLNSVLGFAQLLEGDQLTPEQRESVAYISRAGRHLLELINEVLDIARIDTGSLTISVEAVAVRECVEEATALVLPMAAAREIDVDIQSATTSSAYLLADRQRLRQVLLNLLSNAVKYNSHRGKITVRCRELSGRRLRIDVSDTGPGIAPSILPRLFQPFDRLGAERTEIEGAGIGLTLSKALVEAMGGEIGAESVVGSGSTFWIAFPTTTAPGEALSDVGERADTVALRGPQHDLLYIEDNPANLRLVERIVERMPGFRLMTAMQGSIGLEMARESRPRLVLLDLHLPDMDGSDVLRQLRVDPETSDLSVVVLTADGSERRRADLLAAGADAYLTKPIDVEELKDVVERLVGASREDPSQ